MTSKPLNQLRRPRQLTVDWQDSAWFPPVGRFRPLPVRPLWRPHAIITDITGCLGRVPTPIKL